MQSILLFCLALKSKKKKGDNKFLVCKISKKVSSKLQYVYREFKGPCANSVDPDEAAYYEPPLLDLWCLQIQSFSFGTLTVNRFPEIHINSLESTVLFHC